MDISGNFRQSIKGYERLGTYTSPDNEKLDVLIVHLEAPSKLERARAMLRNFVAEHLKSQDNKEAALVAFVSPGEKQWRFSYVKMEYNPIVTASGKVGLEKQLTPARRFSYIVGESESCHTAQSRFLELLCDTKNNPTLAQLENAFSVESVTKEFFGQYKELFLTLKDSLDTIQEKNKKVQKEFAVKNIDTADFAKKLMGQIVFLYFLQKKGWLGVQKGKEWGTGTHHFLRGLFDKEFCSYKNFFNDVLEPLFYDTLATDRGAAAWCELFQCRIPFLNGGLFEPLEKYDWQGIDIVLPNDFFSNTTKIAKTGDVGTGILDVFDRYNFTVNEAEPLEKDVAIDPEMLGKVFEELLEIKERKSKGSYYTPREIVHYMCQESLVNYLDTSLNGERIVVPRGDIETLIHSGDQIAQYDSANASAAVKTMPSTISKHAKIIDEKLAEIAVCDPAIGSGAFPVGMMMEIVRSRGALTSYFSDSQERNAYVFKRHAIQNCLYGVDLDPGAVDIAKLRLWLSLVVDEEDVKKIKPLPNLDYKIVVGNSLLGVDKNLFNDHLFKQLEDLKAKYFSATGEQEKSALKEKIDSLILELTGGKQDFDFEIYFSEVFHHKKGFDVVIANPPYIDSEAMTKESPELRKTIQATYSFTRGNWDIYIAFYERAFSVSNIKGVVSFITPDKWISKPFGDQLRIETNNNLRSIIRAGRSVFENALVDAIVTVFVKYDQPSLYIFDCVQKKVLLKRIVSKETLSAPYTYDWLFSDFVDLLTKLTAHTEKMSTYGLCENACATSDAYKLKEIIVEEKNAHDSEYMRIINTGTIDKYISKWGRRDMVYLGDKYAKPVVHKQTFLSAFPNSYGQKAIKPKLIIKGLNLLDVCLDASGTTIPGKTTLIVTAKSSDVLKLLAGILNSKLAFFYLKEKYPASSYNKGTTFTKEMINAFPIPTAMAAQQQPIIKLVDQILLAKSVDPKSDTGAFEREIDRLVYVLYDLTEDEIRIIEGGV